MISIQRQSLPFDAAIEVPGSKSISNRVLILAALSEGETRIENLQFSDDSKRMLACLKNLGYAVEWDAQGKWAVIQGQGAHIPNSGPEHRTGPALFVGNAGTAARFLPCLAAIGTGKARFEGDPRMSARPMSELTDVLAAQGATISFLESVSLDIIAPLGSDVQSKPLKTDKGYPFLLEAHGLKGGEIPIDISRSTQFASGLLMAAPYAQSDITLALSGDREQTPYVDMTAQMMQSFGAEVKKDGHRWTVARRAYQSPGRYLVEPDFSGAAYFFAAAALIGGKVTVKGAQAASLQGDIAFLKVLQHMGCAFFEDPDGLTVEKEPGRVLKGVDVNMNAFSDQALTLAALAPFCDRPTKISGIAHSRKQESDRVHAIVKNLQALGCSVEERPDGVTITPGPLHGATIETFGDHRVAMAFSLVGLIVPGVVIDDEKCVGKTFEEYWVRFAELQNSHV